jgi:hypothetical protein
MSTRPVPSGGPENIVGAGVGPGGLSPAKASDGLAELGFPLSEMTTTAIERE